MLRIELLAQNAVEASVEREEVEGCRRVLEWCLTQELVDIVIGATGRVFEEDAPPQRLAAADGVVEGAVCASQHENLETVGYFEQDHVEELWEGEDARCSSWWRRHCVSEGQCVVDDVENGAETDLAVVFPAYAVCCVIRAWQNLGMFAFWSCKRKQASETTKWRVHVQ